MNLFSGTDPATERKPALLQTHYNTPRRTWQSALKVNSERSELDAQEFFRILPEISDKQAQI
ncbi:MAG: hypothetical protein WCA41_05045, partial [Candidatus Acidiferrum sp.]